MRILTLNVNGGLDFTRRRFVLPALRDAIRDVDADIVLLQEVLAYRGRHAHSQRPLPPQHEYLAEGHWQHHAYARNVVLSDRDQGNALLSRWSIEASVNHDVSIAGHEPRGLLHVRLGTAPPSAVHVICLHLGLLDSHRRHQLARLTHLIQNDIPADAALIVAGDFNDWRARGDRTLQGAGMTETYASLHGRLPRTFPARRPVLPLDRIYVRHANVQSAEVLCAAPWSRLSDHAALLSDISLHKAVT